MASVCRARQLQSKLEQSDDVARGSGRSLHGMVVATLFAAPALVSRANADTMGLTQNYANHLCIAATDPSTFFLLAWLVAGGFPERCNGHLARNATGRWAGKRWAGEAHCNTRPATLSPLLRRRVPRPLCSIMHLGRQELLFGTRRAPTSMAT